MINLATDEAVENHGDEGDKQRLRLWLRLLKVSRYIEGELRERLRKEYATTLPRFDVMSALYRAEKGLKMSELSAALMVSNGNVTGIIERLVAEGLVLREPLPGDRRVMLVLLTPEGREKFRDMALVHQGWVSELLKNINARDAATICDILDVKLVRTSAGREGEKE
ncbi:MarR family winged helix-turn-helix transcriptional regulator [Sneathiella chinensis]|uniref:MarR family transcriptional regulator n=1 Tax=Sneathiella chinensis TaxID=349750 RepID=A0ABQ5TYH7_9PROT|nr:MarR family transcriptional regulator [Sneathiella chinensis]GLQ04852.1 MarR family transcriptional regulator [Sneathiella chinensis]